MHDMCSPMNSCIPRELLKILNRSILTWSSFRWIPSSRASSWRCNWPRGIDGRFATAVDSWVALIDQIDSQCHDFVPSCIRMLWLKSSMTTWIKDRNMRRFGKLNWGILDPQEDPDPPVMIPCSLGESILAKTSSPPDKLIGFMHRAARWSWFNSRNIRIMAGFTPFFRSDRYVLQKLPYIWMLCAAWWSATFFRSTDHWSARWKEGHPWKPIRCPSFKFASPLVPPAHSDLQMQPCTHEWCTMIVCYDENPHHTTSPWIRCQIWLKMNRRVSADTCITALMYR